MAKAMETTQKNHFIVKLSKLVFEVVGLSATKVKDGMNYFCPHLSYKTLSVYNLFALGLCLSQS